MNNICKRIKMTVRGKTLQKLHMIHEDDIYNVNVVEKLYENDIYNANL